MTKKPLFGSFRTPRLRRWQWEHYDQNIGYFRFWDSSHGVKVYRNNYFQLTIKYSYVLASVLIAVSWALQQFQKGVHSAELQKLKQTWYFSSFKSFGSKTEPSGHLPSPIFRWLLGVSNHLMIWVVLLKFKLQYTWHRTRVVCFKTWLAYSIYWCFTAIGQDAKTCVKAFNIGWRNDTSNYYTSKAKQSSQSVNGNQRLAFQWC